MPGKRERQHQGPLGLIGEVQSYSEVAILPHVTKSELLGIPTAATATAAATTATPAPFLQSQLEWYEPRKVSIRGQRNGTATQLLPSRT